MAVTMFGGEGRTELSFAAVSAGSTIIDMLTWVLVIEIVRSAHYSALLVVATGRLAIHFGMASGEVAALLARDHMTAFFVISIAALMLAMGYMFTDRATTFIFEPPMAGEIPAMVPVASEAPVMNNGPTISNDAVSSSAGPPDSPMGEIVRRYGLSREKRKCSSFGRQDTERRPSRTSWSFRLPRSKPMCDTSTRNAMFTAVRKSSRSSRAHRRHRRRVQGMAECKA